MANPILAPNTSERWTKCTPSARLCAGYDVRITDFNMESSCEGFGHDHDAKDVHEGRECHLLAAYQLKRVLGHEAVNPVSCLHHYNEEMAESADDYCALVMDRVRDRWQQGANPTVYVEQRVDYSRFTGIPDCVGIADCIVISDGTLDIFDLKYGRGVPVHAEGNTQLMIYALAALDLCGGRNITEVRMTIVQPRRDNFAT